VTQQPVEGELLLDLLSGLGTDLDLDAVLRRVVEASCTLTGAQYGMFRGPIVGEHGTDPALTASGRALDIPMKWGGNDLGQLYLGGKRDGFSDADRDAVTRLIAAAAPAIMNALRYTEIEQRRLWLEGTVLMAGNLARTSSVEEADQGVVDAIHAMSQAPLVILVRGSGEGLRVAACVGHKLSAEMVIQQLHDEIVGVIETGEFRTIHRDEGADTIVAPVLPRLAPPAVLLVDHAGQWGLLRAVEEDVMTTISNHVALFLDRAHLTQERQRLLVATDRERIARDLHDLVIQRIFATGLQLQALRQGSEPRLGDHLADAVRELDLAMSDLRATVFELRRQPTISFLAEVEALLDEYAGVLGFRPTLRYTGPIDSSMGGLVGEHALLTLRESLSNVAKHARATSVGVTITATSRDVTIVIDDDGIGLEASARRRGVKPGSGNGIDNLRGRAADLGGVLTIEPGGPGRSGGTRVTWTVPTTRARL
jgi:signal transduction histidine kinase